MMAAVNRFLQKHILWAGFVAVLLPLGLMLGLQYSWLVDLEEKTAIAEEAYLWNYLEGFTGKIENFYRAQAERSLNLPPYVFVESDPEMVAHYFRKRRPEGAKLLFAVNFVHDGWGGILVFDPLTELFGNPADISMERAISMALAPWKAASEKGSPIQTERLVVEEQDPANRVMINPVTDDNGKVLGVAGMILDSQFFAREIVPYAVEKSLPASRAALFVSIRDGDGHHVYGSRPENRPTFEISGRIPFIFSDWTISLGNLERTPEEWAKSNFALNVSLSALLALALLGGLTFALRAASREMRLSRMKADFVSNVSHELRTPLASIRVFGEFLRLGRVKSPEKSREYGEYIETESRRLTQLINNILDFSRIESEAKTYAMTPTDLESVLADTLRSLKVSLKHKGFELRYEPPETEIPELDLDPDAIGQAVANLVDNAVKYSGSCHEVTVSLAQSNGEVLIAVSDRGIGISTEEQARIFERFHRVSTGLVHDIKGSGLGLSIVTHIITAHGGKVSVESESGKGSTFTLHLPVQSGALPNGASLPPKEI
jgi:signal transduction histidine kinase